MALCTLVTLSSCGWLTAEPRPEPVDEPGAAFVFDDPARPPDPGFELPLASRPQPPECIPLRDWTLQRTGDRAVMWQTRLPVRSRAMFFHRAPPGMTVRREADSTVVPHQRDTGDKSRGMWTYDADTITLHLPEDAGKPSSEFCMRWPAATARAHHLNLSFGESDERWKEGPPTVDDQLAHLYQTIQEDETSYTGLFLPAPSRVTWTVNVPPAGELWMRPGIVRPEVGTHTSDGATLHVDVEAGGSQATVWSRELSAGSFDDVRVDLSKWAGQSVKLTLRSDPGANSDVDYVFLGDPTLTSRQKAPRRAVIVFIDTLRADHLGTYGHTRDTSPTLDAWASDALVFEQARSVAPWTLPSTRTMMTGRQPEFFGHNDSASPADTLQGFLGRRGWATAMYAGNVYLSAAYGLNRHFDIHHDVKWPTAEQQVDQALGWFERNEGRDAFLLLHFMDAHLPYEEPAAYRDLFAGEAPEGLSDSFHRPQVIRARLDEDGKDWVRGRYDNNIRYIDDQLGRLFATLPDDAVVMVVSDHGEEFWEHGGYEHGHALWDEVVHVPMMLSAPSVAPGRLAEPVSMLDVTPTFLAAIDDEWALDETDGLNLLTRLDEAGRSELSERKLGIGRPLYGSMQWGVTYQGDKYATTEGVEHVFNIATDARETKDLLKPHNAELAQTWRHHLSDALPGVARMGYRIIPSRPRNASRELTIRMTVPGGIDHVVIGTDPLEISAVTISIEGDVLTATWVKGLSGTRELFVIPTGDSKVVTPALSLELSDGVTDPVTVQPTGRYAATPDTGATRILSKKYGGRTIAVTWGVARIPGEGEGQIIAASEEQAEWLKELGYTDDDAENEDSAGDSEDEKKEAAHEEAAPPVKKKRPPKPSQPHPSPVPG